MHIILELEEKEILPETLNFLFYFFNAKFI